MSKLELKGICDIMRQLIISFSGRKSGNCDEIATYISTDSDNIVYFRELKVHECNDCNYECFKSHCKYREDDVYKLYESMPQFDKVIFVVPMYCGNPSSLYFKFNERGQDYFMHNEGCYEDIISKLYIIGVYGDKEKIPDFIPCFEKWFEGTAYRDHVLGIERHKYGQKMEDKILDVEEVREMLKAFV